MNVRVNGCLSLNTWTVIDQWAVDIVYCCLWFFVILFMDPRGEAAYIKDKCIHLHILILFHVDVVNLNLFKLHNHLKGVSNQHNIHFLIWAHSAGFLIISHFTLFKLIWFKVIAQCTAKRPSAKQRKDNNMNLTKRVWLRWAFEVVCIMDLCQKKKFW